MKNFFKRKAGKVIERLLPFPNTDSTAEATKGDSEPSILPSLDAASKEISASGDAMISWGGLNLPVDLAKGHYLVCGGDKSGKSATIQQLVRSLAPLLQDETAQHRVCILDPKQSWFPLLGGLGLEDCIATINPHDARGLGWDIAKDIQSATDAGDLAMNLLPESKSARGVLAAVIEAFILLSGDTWTLRDIAIVLRSSTSVKALLNASEKMRSHCVKSDDLGSDRFEELFVAFRPELSEVASGWERATKSLNLTNWHKSGSIFLWGSQVGRNRISESLDRFFLQSIASMNSKNTSLWLFLDDFCEARPLLDLPLWLSTGAGGGISCVMGINSISSTAADYGEGFPEHLLSCSEHILVLKQDEEAAEVISQVLPTVEADKLLNLRVPSKSDQHGLDGIGKSSLVSKPYRVEVEYEQFFRDLLEPDIYTEPLVGRPFGPLKEWDNADLARLSLTSIRSTLLSGKPHPLFENVNRRESE